MTKQIKYKRTVVGFYNVREAGSDVVIATLSPSDMAALLGFKPAGWAGCAEINTLKVAI
ncbi:hypothetical protein K7T73_15955 [Bacillus badius]|uniref:hypothetical protein n=1 Tax=Bacillus badius TaxID=1455 RepID=UPI001CBB26D0|nr:hypothetical protein [Bacillus badius]UAT30032.1 hypothetical protein K7T73_15955 [Bacillus badius]